MGTSFEFPKSDEEYQACKEDPGCEEELDLWAERQAAQKKFKPPLDKNEFAVCMSNASCKNRVDSLMNYDFKGRNDWMEQMKEQYGDPQLSMPLPDEGVQTHPDDDSDTTTELIKGLGEDALESVPYLGKVVKGVKTVNQIRKGETTAEQLILDLVTDPIAPLLKIGEAQNKEMDKLRKHVPKMATIRAPNFGE